MRLCLCSCTSSIFHHRMQTNRAKDQDEPQIAQANPMSLKQLASFSAQSPPSSKQALAKPGAVESPAASIRSFKRCVMLSGGWEPPAALKRFSD